MPRVSPSAAGVRTPVVDEGTDHVREQAADSAKVARHTTGRQTASPYGEHFGFEPFQAIAAFHKLIALLRCSFAPAERFLISP